MNKEKLLKILDRAAQLARIAADWDLGTDGKVEIDEKWVSCNALEKEFQQAAQEVRASKLIQ